MRLETLAGPPPHRSIARTNNAVIFVRASIAKIKLLACQGWHGDPLFGTADDRIDGSSTAWWCIVLGARTASSKECLHVIILERLGDAAGLPAETGKLLL
jgi:hypothetical protein